MPYEATELDPNCSIRCGLMTPYGDIDLGLYGHQCWLINGTNAQLRWDLLHSHNSNSTGNNYDINLKDAFENSELPPHLPGANELT